MKGYLTSYAGLFNAQPGGAPTVGSIEVPLIQRDYAQGAAWMPRSQRSGPASSKSC